MYACVCAAAVLVETFLTTCRFFCSLSFVPSCLLPILSNPAFIQPCFIRILFFFFFVRSLCIFFRFSPLISLVSACASSIFLPSCSVRVSALPILSNLFRLSVFHLSLSFSLFLSHFQFLISI